MVHIARTPIRHNQISFNIGDILKDVEQDALDRLVEIGAAKVLDVETQILAPAAPPVQQAATKQAAAPAQTAAPAAQQPVAQATGKQVAVSAPAGEEKPIEGINPELVPSGEKK